MEQLTSAEVAAALTSWLGNTAIVELSRDHPNGRITGWIMHPHFTGVSTSERQSWLWNGFDSDGSSPRWKGLREEFKDRSAQIGLILTYSPSEYENALDETA